MNEVSEQPKWVKRWMRRQELDWEARKVCESDIEASRLRARHPRGLYASLSDFVRSQNPYGGYEGKYR